MLPDSGVPRVSLLAPRPTPGCTVFASPPNMRRGYTNVKRFPTTSGVHLLGQTQYVEALVDTAELVHQVQGVENLCNNADRCAEIVNGL